MSEAKRDLRPEGSILLQATMYSEWSRALFIATAAAGAGLRVNIETVEHRATRGLPLQTIEVQK